MAKVSRRVHTILLGIWLALGHSLARASPTTTLFQSVQTTVAISSEQPAPTSETMQFKCLSIADGLSQSSVTVIMQDRQGFMWIGTQGGLNRYDGYQFVAYRHDPDDPHSLSDDRVNAIWEDSRGELWVGTERGLDRFDRATGEFSHFLYAGSDPSASSVGAILSIYQDSSGTLWVGAVSGLNRFDRVAGSFTPFLPNRVIRVIHQDRQGQLWIGTNDGLVRFDYATGAFVPQDTTGMSDLRPRSIYGDSRGVLWIGTDGGGLNGFAPRTAEGVFQSSVHYRHAPGDAPDVRFGLSDDRVLALLEDSEGKLWIGTAAGLDMLSGDRDRLVHYRHDPADPSSLSDDMILALYEDRSGMLWVGTHDGLCKHDPIAGQFALYQQGVNALGGLSDNLVQAIYQDLNGTLWVGTFAGGLNRLDGGSTGVTVYRHDPADSNSPSSDDVRVLYGDHDGALWLGTDMGLDRFDPQTEEFTHFDSLSDRRVTVIIGDRSSYLWIGTSAGLYRFDRVTGVARSLDAYGLHGSYVLALYKDQNGMLWVGTYGGGINLWDDVHNRFIHYLHAPDDPQSLSNDVVLSFLETPTLDGWVLWVGTRTGGLARFDPHTETFTHYSERDGLPGDTVGCMLADAAGYLWLGTDRGLSRFDPRSGSCRNYNAHDGLQRGEFLAGSCFQSARGEMFFGGYQGMNSFFPQQIRTNSNPPLLVVTSFDKYDPSIRSILSTGDRLELAPQDNSISFEFTAMDYTAPERNQFAYMMEGIEQDWVYAGTRRHVDYADLDPGEYVLRVRGSNSDGVWNEDGVAIYLAVATPFWLTWWFRGLVLLALVGIVVAGYRSRVRRHEEQSWRLETLVKERTVALSITNARLEQEIAERMRIEDALAQQAAEAAVVAERNRLARDMHDALTQSLYSLTLLAEAGRRMIKAGELRRIAANQDRLSEIAQQMLQELRLMVFELRPQALRDKGLLAALERRIEAVEQRVGLEARLVAKDVRPLPAHVEVELYHIALESLNNVLKHAAASTVTVIIGVMNGVIELQVIDDGKGFDTSRVRGSAGLGLVGMRERVRTIGGTLQVTSAPGEGTSVRVSLAVETGPPQAASISGRQADE